jgi:23S rRNA (adenine2503-C2)-methyltransferase
MKIFNVPTGKICIRQFDKGKLEFLSIGDYGSVNNVKADFLGLTKEIQGVPNGEIMPLEEKWVITISSQYSCISNCKFCDVPNVNNGRAFNATYNDLKNQVIEALKLYPNVLATKRLNVHVARMGEPTWNKNVIKFGMDLLKIVRPYINRSHVHPVVSTMLPKKNKKLMEFLNAWTIDIKNEKFRGAAGLQFSINSTNDDQRDDMFNNSSLNLKQISEIGRSLIDPIGRKYTLNFALADNYQIDAIKLKKLFSPNKFIVKITPLHATMACDKNHISTTDGYEYFAPYKEAEEQLKNEGFDVLVFVPSYDEDLGRITCGNAILSGTRPQTKYTVEYK